MEMFGRTGDGAERGGSIVVFLCLWEKERGGEGGLISISGQDSVGVSSD